VDDDFDYVGDDCGGGDDDIVDEKRECKQGDDGDGDNVEFLITVLNVYVPLDGLEYEVRNGAVEIC
jgi:hypothetical protein